MNKPKVPEQAHPLLMILSGPSGVGKDAVVSRMRSLGKPFRIVVTVTTRLKRHHETDGVDYFFRDRGAFKAMLLANEFLEWAEVYGNLYGTPKSQITEALESGIDVVAKTDVQGAFSIRKLVADAVFVFLAPPNMEELAHRLSQRMTESPDAFRLRLETAESEMKEADKFDHIVVNHEGKLDDAVAAIEKIAASERERLPPRRVQL